tara:strand:- start:1820 stop:2659 length:840 start_codon:yes stop_codon:yes gene_type:complete
MDKEIKKMYTASARLQRVVYNDFMEKTANPAIMGIARALLPALKSLGPQVLKLVAKVPPAAWANIIPTIVRGIAPKENPAGVTASSSSKEAFGPAAGLAMRMLAPAALDMVMGDDDEPEDMDASSENEEDMDEDKEGIAPLAGLALSTLAPMALDSLMGDDDEATTASKNDENDEDEDEDKEGLGPLAGLALSTLAPMAIDSIMGDDDEATTASAHCEVIETVLKKHKVAHAEIVAKSLYLAALETRNSHKKKPRKAVAEAVKLVQRMQDELEALRAYL